MSKEKKYTVRFYAGFSENGAPKISKLLKDIYNDFLNKKPIPHIRIEEKSYELRNFVSLNDGTSFKGVLATVRDDAPHIRKSNGKEETIKLEEDEGVMEKNHFLYFKKNELLVWQQNSSASFVGRFAQYLSTICEKTVSFDDILTKESWKKLESGNIRKFEFKVSRPKSDLIPNPSDWTQKSFDLMNGLDANSITITTAAKRGKNLAAPTKAIIRNLLQTAEIQKLKVTPEYQEPIDLLADRISTKISVKMDGKYPILDDIFNKLDVAKNKKQKELDEHFGEKK